MSFFPNEIGPAVFQDFIGYIPVIVEGETKEGNIKIITRAYTLIKSIFNLLIVKEYRVGGRQKYFTQMSSKNVKLATEQLVGAIRNLVESWEHDELDVPSLEVGEENKRLDKWNVKKKYKFQRQLRGKSSFPYNLNGLEKT